MDTATSSPCLHHFIALNNRRATCSYSPHRAQVAKLTKKEISFIALAYFGVAIKDSDLKAVHVACLEELIAAQPTFLDSSTSFS